MLDVSKVQVQHNSDYDFCYNQTALLILTVASVFTTR